MEKTKVYLLALFFVTISLTVSAQIKSREDLSKAIELYNSGLYDQAVEVLELSMKNYKYKSSEKKQALKYLAASHYEIDNIEKADKASYTFLKKDPLYEAQTTDPILFVQALQKYELFPSLSINFSIGQTQLTPIVKEIYTVWDNADYSQNYIISNYYNFNSGITKSIYKGFSVSLGISISDFSYGRKINFTDTTYINFKESTFAFKVPLELSYTRNLYKKLSASVYAGVYYVRYLNPKVTLAGSSLGAGMFAQITEAEFDMTNFRNIDNVGTSLGFGLNYRINRFTVNLKVNSFVNSLDYTKKEKGFINPAELNVYYADDLFNIKEMTYSLGVSYTFSYKVKSRY